MADTVNTYDYIIVGAGSAGCVLAGRLTEDPDVKVLVIEAGGGDKNPYVHMPMAFRLTPNMANLNWGYETEPEPGMDNRRIPIPRGKLLGGSSSINGLVYMRGHSRDYDQWRQMGCEGWSYADLLPYFKRSESSWRGETKFHGGSGPIKVTRVYNKHLNYEKLAASVEAAGYNVTDDLHGDEQEGLGIGEITVRNGRRNSAFRGYLKPAMKRPNLDVEIRAQTSRVLIDHGRAVGVEYWQDGQIHTARAEREVILSGGSYNSPQVLMLSGIGDPADMAEHGIKTVHELKGVGKNLSEHPFARLEFAANGESWVPQLRFDRFVGMLAQWAVFGTGMFATNGCPGQVFLRTRPELERPNIQLTCTFMRYDAKVWFPGIRPMQNHGFSPPVLLLHPESRGWVKLRSANPSDKARIQFNLFKEKADMDAMIEGLKALRRIYRSGPLGKIVSRELVPGDHLSDADLAAYVRRTGGIMHHPVGTCTMGHGPNAVVDPQLRVHGLEGLRVVDASVMPTVPGGNTNMPTIALAEKASDLIRGRQLERAEI